ncbi:hypothetical protein BF29_506 [Heyndrickxia coagulans DSM 1 = ATCC 7050]|uniref:Uncharacterized protein n=1 Tax=Heyndrickxia coagulans DSM 1 = ATCC 7050 TaxID=1121088 RepID=A0A8B4BWG5_HEYCO|nr:hypothetical protein BF29_506 [Heyndrickxia coagulans DSM 1 = ATCC 7050]SHF55808.1 hypothetical protein SAMN02745208_02257 [Heyndrickxia coagulans DSM 1 = ATCC 7050]
MACLLFGMGLLRFFRFAREKFLPGKNPRLKPGAGSIIFCPG